MSKSNGGLRRPPTRCPEATVRDLKDPLLTSNPSLSSGPSDAPDLTFHRALPGILRSVDAVKNLPALYALLATFATAGLLLSMAESSFARAEPGPWGAAQLAAAVFVAFYGGNAAGLLLMDDARGLAVRDVATAVGDSLRSSHRLLLVLAILLTGVAALLALLAGALWLCRVDVSGLALGPALFGLLVPLGVLGSGFVALALVALVVPLAAPGIWCGDGVIEVTRRLLSLARRRLLSVAMLTGAVSLLTAAVGALVSFGVLAGGRVLAALSLTVVGVDVPAERLMAGLFGHGLRSLGATGAPLGSTGHAAAALVGGGVVFALALLLPGLVYLRGNCTVYLALTGRSRPSNGDLRGTP